MRRSQASAAATLLSVTLLAGCSGEEGRKHAKPGDIFHATSSLTGYSTYVNVPAARIDLNFEPQLVTLDDIRGLDGPAVLAPSDGIFVGITWSAWRRLPGALGPGDLMRDLKPTSFTLVADKTRYALASPLQVKRGSGDGATKTPDSLVTPDPASVFVAIKGRPKHLA